MTTRRDFLKKASYAAPVVLTMSASPAFAKRGSGNPNSSFREHFQEGQEHFEEGFEDGKEWFEEHVIDNLNPRNW